MRREHNGVARARGQQAEDLACVYLEAAGLQLRARNVRCRVGEIDLVMQAGDQLVFVEVRYRKTACFGSAAESVTGYKRRRIQQAAAYYLHSVGLSEAIPYRFDVVALSGPLKGATIEWIQYAF